MATRYDVERIVRTFKAHSNVACRITEPTENQMMKLVDTFGAEILNEIASTVTANSLWDIMNESFIRFYQNNKSRKPDKASNEEIEKLKEANKVLADTTIKLAEQLNEAKAEAAKAKAPAEDDGRLSLGLVEKALARVMVEEYSPVLAESVIGHAKAFIEKEYGKIQKVIEYKIPEKGKIEEVTHEEFETVLSFVMMNEPVMLVGPAGTGKNVICKQIAKILGLDFYFSNAVTQEYKLTGFIDANGTYQETEFYKAFKNGGVFMLDEIDASIPEVLVILNAAIANRYFDFPNGKIEAHENFRVIAAGNTFGLGASYQYVGRNQLDAASLDRFAQVEINYSPKIEEALTKDKELINFIRKFRKECAESGNNHIVSYRTITRLDKMAQVMPIEKCLKTCLLKNMEQDSLNMIVRKFKAETRWESALRNCVNN